MHNRKYPPPKTPRPSPPTPPPSPHGESIINTKNPPSEKERRMRCLEAAVSLHQRHGDSAPSYTYVIETARNFFNWVEDKGDSNV